MTAEPSAWAIVPEPELDVPAWQMRRPDETRAEYAERMIELTRAHLAAQPAQPAQPASPGADRRECP